MKRFVLICFALLPLITSAQLPLLLNHGKAQLIGVPPNQGFVNYFNYQANFYGDSMTSGYLLNSPTNRFSSLLSAQYYLVETNYGAGGSQIIDSGESDLITANNSISNNTISSPTGAQAMPRKVSATLSTWRLTGAEPLTS